MRMYDLILKKRNGGVLSRDEIKEMITGYLEETIPDYQMSAMLMAIYFQGMTDEETTDLTEIMAKSGEMMDLSGISGIKVDKHSTGGVGDKTSLIVAPLAAACQVKIAKMSGRGLGHTGGTVDKLESIPGFQTSLSRKDFFDTVEKAGLCMIGQTGNLTPADKKLYALRDVTATVESIPLIAASIMSKKLAAGSDCILLDVKTGSGAFMKTEEDARKLARTMTAIGNKAGRTTIALITNMDIPLGNYIGNALEVEEAVATLKGEGPEDLTELCIELAANMVYLARKGTLEECREQVKAAIENGTGLKALMEMTKAQGGDVEVLKHTELLPKAPYSYQVIATKEGFLQKMNTQECGMTSVLLGGGREKKDDPIDPGAGLILHKKPGDYVTTGDSLATLYASSPDLFSQAEQRFLQGIVIGTEKPQKSPLILERMTGEEE